jgi:hypothetical protein
MTYFTMKLKPLTALLLIGLFHGTAVAEYPVPESPKWLTYPGGEGPGKGKHVVFIVGDQEYRSEQSMPMMAGILSKHHGFDCTVLFAIDENGMVDPTAPTDPPKDNPESFKKHDIPGLEYLKTADLMILYTRHLTLPEDQQKLIVDYLDSGKPLIGLRTANHGFRGPLPYEIDGKRAGIGEILGGAFMNHHGIWHGDSTRGDIVPEMKDSPILIGVKDIWGPSDVYRTFKEGTGLPEGCTALVMGQPLIGRGFGGKDNPEKEPLPVVWTKGWKTSKGETARVLQCTMGSGQDFESPGLRRLLVNGVYWGLEMGDKISADSSVEYTSEYKPLGTGFNYEKLGVVPHPPAFFR